MMVFKRNMTRADCKASKFSGIRKCEVSQNHEIWANGSLIHEVSEFQLQTDPQAVQKAYAKVFKLGQEQVIVI